MPNITRLAAAANLACLKFLLVWLSPGDRSWLARQVVQERAHPKTRALIDFSYGAIRGWKNIDFDINVNGEAALFDRLRPFKPRVVFDVGANVGDWSTAILKRIPEAVIHAFEIAPATFARLAPNTTSWGNRIIINAIGLSDKEGETTLYYTPNNDTASSTLSPELTAAANHQVQHVEVMAAPTTTGDIYMRKHGIEHIDVLKIDVEGAELSVLHGFSDAFAAGAIDLVQFEYGMVGLRTRIFLEDFYEFFTAHGFAVGKLFPNGVGFKPYELIDEDFIGLNFIACHRDRSDIIAAIGCPPLSLQEP
jgi:FkbM family methyltransferase